MALIATATYQLLPFPLTGKTKYKKILIKFNQLLSLIYQKISRTLSHIANKLLHNLSIVKNSSKSEKGKT